MNASGKSPHRALALIALLGLALLWASHLNTPYSRIFGFADYIGSENTRFSYNHVRYGFAETKGAQIRNLEAAAPEDRVYYHAHPGLLDILTGAVMGLTGSRDAWATRLLPILAAICSFVLIFRNSRDGPVDPWLSLAILAILPMTAIHGNNFSYEPFCQAVVLGICLLHERGWRYRLLPLLYVGGFFDYPSLYVAPFLALVAFVRPRLESEQGWTRRILWTAALGTTCLLSIGTHLLHLIWSMGGLQGTQGPAWHEYIFHVISQGTQYLPPFAEFLSKQYDIVVTGFTLPGILLGVWALLRYARKLPLVAYAFLWVGLLHFFAFPGHADKHDFWLTYLAPFFALSIAFVLQRFERSPRYFLFGLIAVLGARSSVGIWAERAAPPVREVAADLTRLFPKEAVLHVFRTPANWALENYRHTPVAFGEELLLPGRAEAQLTTCLENLGTFSLLERPQIAVMPIRELRAEYLALLQQVFPKARLEDRIGDFDRWACWDIRRFLLDPGASPYFQQALGEAALARVRDLGRALRLLPLLPPGARIAFLGAGARPPELYRSRWIQISPDEDSVPPDARWICALARSPAGERLRKLGARLAAVGEGTERLEFRLLKRP